MNPTIIALLILVIVGLGIATWKAPRLTSVIVWSLVATIFVGAAALIALPGNFSDKALWLTLSVPLIWAGFQFWTYWEKSAWRVVIGLVGVTIIAAFFVFTMEPTIG